MQVGHLAEHALSVLVELEQLPPRGGRGPGAPLFHLVPAVGEVMVCQEKKQHSFKPGNQVTVFPGTNSIVFIFIRENRSCFAVPTAQFLLGKTGRGLPVTAAWKTVHGLPVTAAWKTVIICRQQHTFRSSGTTGHGLQGEKQHSFQSGKQVMLYRQQKHSAHSGNLGGAGGTGYSRRRLPNTNGSAALLRFSFAKRAGWVTPGLGSLSLTAENQKVSLSGNL